MSSTELYPAAAPAYLTSLIGRDAALDEIRALLGERRLVSLVGTGGSGKTRLAAAVLASFDAQQRTVAAWVDLAALMDPELVNQHIAAAFGLREQPARSLIDAVSDHIGDDPALLVLDNCEHLVGACAIVADALLRACPALRILATSRQPLGIAGERAWLVPPLSIPEASDAAAAASGAVQLFVERARDALPTFALTASNVDAVTRICRRVDGVPLAIELAAARVRLLPPEQLAQRLDDVFGLLTTRSHVTLPRHRTLRALIDWSYDLLTHEERVLFERVAVFAGGFRLEAVERVTGWGCISSSSVLDLLASLVDKSLVSMRESKGEARYHLLDTVRQYAQERLDGVARGMHTPTEVATLRRRHALHYLDVAERAARQLHGARQLEWLQRLGEEHDNLRAALAWSIAHSDAEIGLRLCIALRDFWRVRAHLTEGRRWMRETMRMHDAPAGLRARTLAGFALLGRMQGDYACNDLLREAEALARSVGDRVALADALTQLGNGLRQQLDLSGARACLDEAIVLWRSLPAEFGLSIAVGARAAVALAEGDLALARALRTEAVGAARHAGDREGEALALIGLGEVARIEGDLDAARTHNESCLAVFQELGDTWHCATALHNLGWIHAERGRLHDALHAFTECIALLTPTGEPYGIALSLYGLARTLYEAGDVEAAALAYATAFHHSERIAKGVAAPADALCCERTRALIESALDADTLARSRAEGARVDIAAGISRAQQRLQALLPPQASSAATDVAPVMPVEPAPDVPDRCAAAQLAVCALGVLQILVDGRPLDGDAFGSSKPRELLLLLLCNNEGCTREQVGYAFWPESSASQVKNSFHVTLHRLRKALGHPEWIVTAGDRYRIDPALRVYVDAAQFEGDVKAALRADDAERLQSVLELYRGEFCEGEIVGDWHLELRDRLRQVHMRALLAFGRRRLADARVQEAAAAFRAILTRDALHEEAYRQLMICHARAGDRVQALRLYQNLTEVLQAELDVEPDETTTGLYERLLRAEPV